MFTSIDPYSTSNSSTGLAAGLVIGFVIFYAAILAFGVYCYVRIARKAGYSGWYVALLFVPIANLVIMLMFVFKEWPIEAELRMLRAGAYGGQPQFGAYGPPVPGAPPYAGPSQFAPGQPAPWGETPQQPYGYPPADGGPQA